MKIPKRITWFFIADSAKARVIIGVFDKDLTNEFARNLHAYFLEKSSIGRGPVTSPERAA